MELAKKDSMLREETNLSSRSSTLDVHQNDIGRRDAKIHRYVQVFIRKLSADRYLLATPQQNRDLFLSYTRILRICHSK